MTKKNNRINDYDSLADFNIKMKPWQKLAAAIVISGIKDKDEEFLNSDWCQELIDFAAGKDLYKQGQPASCVGLNIL